MNEKDGHSKKRKKGKMEGMLNFSQLKRPTDLFAICGFS